MSSKLFIHNTLTRKKEEFRPLDPPFVGLYVCGPTVYGDPHLGHARPAITFDILFRYLQSSGYRVRYVRNITDVGHLENDADEGEDKIAKKARLDEVEPMEISHHYTVRYHDAMRLLNVLTPSIEPLASGHIIEQIEFVKKILRAGYAYESNGSVYFDVEKYDKKYGYGKLSGRQPEDMRSGTRSLDGQGDKKSSLDFALWKRASAEHIMRWPSPWSEGFPGWHMECSAMSTKYLGKTFDIHGGGMDLMFPHHECEMAQNTAADGHPAARYWMHNNMVTINGQKMGKSLGNFITLEQMFSGDHSALAKAYSPMTIRFFILQAHYRSTLDFSNEALQAAEKGLDRLMKGAETLGKLKADPDGILSQEQAEAMWVYERNDLSRVYGISELRESFAESMNDDLNTPLVIASLFDWVRVINRIYEGELVIPAHALDALRLTFAHIVGRVLGLEDEKQSGTDDKVVPLVEMLLDIRTRAKENKDWAASDLIRDRMAAIGIRVKDRKDGYDWEIE